LVDEQAIAVSQRLGLIPRQRTSRRTDRDRITPQALHEEAAIGVRDPRVLLGDVRVRDDPVIARYPADRQPALGHDTAPIGAEGRRLGTDNFQG
jgi:hypothetical protein